MIKRGTPIGMVLSWFREGLNTYEIAARLGMKEHTIARILKDERDAEYHAAIAAQSEQSVAGHKTGADVQVTRIHGVENSGPMGRKGPDRNP